VKVIILKSFTYNKSGGNEAGLVVLDNEISEEKMQKIAADLGLSETAFLKRIDDKNFDVRFFTSVCEVELCGHATIAAFYYVGETMFENKLGKLKLFQNTKAGNLAIYINYKDKVVDNVMMEQASPKFYGYIEDANDNYQNNSKQNLSIAKSLGVDASFICLSNYDIKPAIVSTGLKDILIPVKDRQILNELKPDFDLISKISEINDAVGYHVYTIENEQIFARNFAPLVGINEECATGTANGALAALLFKENVKKGYFEVLQGEAMDKLSQICIYVDENGVRLGGKAEIVANS
jgi:PhzF family phenazine biosynthesis protein